MLSILLTILKILGIIILCILGLLLLIILLLLFVPVRYRMKLHRKTEEESPFTMNLHFSWLLHIINASFLYPQEVFLRVRLFFFTIYRSDKETSPKEKKKHKPAKEPSSAPETEEIQAAESVPVKKEAQIPVEVHDAEQIAPKAAFSDKTSQKPKSYFEKVISFFKMLWEKIRNIKYTIQAFCDKMKNIKDNIKYYAEVLQSEQFRNSFDLCRQQLKNLYRNIKPRKLFAELTVGTGDPVGTAEILAVLGMLYPYIGNHVSITPDFENAVIEGDFMMQGRVHAIVLIKIAWLIYFNKDIRQVIQMFNKTA